jgi:hypothetical protein
VDFGEGAILQRLRLGGFTSLRKTPKSPKYQSHIKAGKEKTRPPQLHCSADG